MNYDINLLRKKKVYVSPWDMYFASLREFSSVTVYLLLLCRHVSLLLDQGFKSQERCFFHPLSNDVTIGK